MYRIITISKLNADRSDEHHLKDNESCNKALVCKAVNFTTIAGLLLTIYLTSHVLVDMIA